MSLLKKLGLASAIAGLSALSLYNLHLYRSNKRAEQEIKYLEETLRKDLIKQAFLDVGIPSYMLERPLQSADMVFNCGD